MKEINKVDIQHFFELDDGGEWFAWSQSQGISLEKSTSTETILQPKSCLCMEQFTIFSRGVFVCQYFQEEAGRLESRCGFLKHQLLIHYFYKLQVRMSAPHPFRPKRDEQWQTDKQKDKILRTYSSPAAGSSLNCMPIEYVRTILLHPKRFQVRPVVSALGCAKNYEEFAPSRFFAFICEPNPTKFETLGPILKGSLHKWYKFYWNRAGDSPLWATKFENLPIFFFFACQREIWHNGEVPR